MPQIYRDPITGQQVYDDPTKGKVSATTGQVIDSSIFRQQSPIAIPPPRVDTTNYNALTDYGQGAIKAFLPPPVPPVASPDTSDFNTRLNTLMASLSPAPASVETLYQTAYESAGIEASKQEALRKQSAVKSAQAKLAGIQAQIQGVVSKRDVQNLQFERQASAGQVVTEVLNRQQQEVNRQAAIEALPLQALALAAQAEVASLQGESEYAQSTLKIAQDRLDTVFKLKSEDAKSEYEYKKDNRTAIYNFLTAEQKTRAEAKQKIDDREFTLQQNNLNNAQALSIKAMENGQADIAAKITQLDPKSATFVQDLAELQKQIKPKLAAQSDFEQAFLRDKGRLPTVAELLEYKKQQAEITPSKSEVRDASVSQYLQSKKSADGFVSAETYQEALRKFISGGGTQANFLASFPQQTYLRQEEIDKLPAGLKQIQVTPQKALTSDQQSMLNEAKATWDAAKQTYQATPELRERIIKRSKELGFDISPYF